MPVRQGWSYSLEASFLEIYNESIRDLLNTSKEKPAYEIRMKEKSNSKIKEVYVSNLKVSRSPDGLLITVQLEAAAAAKTAGVLRSAPPDILSSLAHSYS